MSCHCELTAGIEDRTKKIMERFKEEKIAEYRREFPEVKEILTRWSIGEDGGLELRIWENKEVTL